MRLNRESSSQQWNPRASTFGPTSAVASNVAAAELSNIVMSAIGWAGLGMHVHSTPQAFPGLVASPSLVQD